MPLARLYSVSYSCSYKKHYMKVEISNSIPESYLSCSLCKCYSSSICHWPSILNKSSQPSPLEILKIALFGRKCKDSNINIKIHQSIENLLFIFSCDCFLPLITILNNSRGWTLFFRALAKWWIHEEQHLCENTI